MKRTNNTFAKCQQGLIKPNMGKGDKELAHQDG